MAGKSPYPQEIRERAVRMVGEVRENYGNEYAAIKAVAARLGIGSPETVRKWLRRAEVDAGERPGLTTEEKAEIKALKQAVAELRRCTAQLAHFPLKFRDPLLIASRGTRPLAAVNFRLLDPGPQSLRVNTQLPADPGQLPMPLPVPLPDPARSTSG